ncbi:hypothetical protein [Amycolatopsis sp. NPDC051071]|uniref:hypothetical protein n=1 Tax=Amycolatopsis sp. NPDC051071 TaxID=3154637 RepID=UPI00342F5DB7
MQKTKLSAIMVALLGFMVVSFNAVPAAAATVASVTGTASVRESYANAPTTQVTVNAVGVDSITQAATGTMTILRRGQTEIVAVQCLNVFSANIISGSGHAVIGGTVILSTSGRQGKTVYYRIEQDGDGVLVRADLRYTSFTVSCELAGGPTGAEQNNRGNYVIIGAAV